MRRGSSSSRWSIPIFPGGFEEGCEASGSPCLSVLEPILTLFKSYLGQNSTPRAGAQHMLNADYFKRIDALNFSMLSDDGQAPENLDHADIVLLGVSRTSKTPTSIYLANRGYKTANVPIVPRLPLPGTIDHLRRPLDCRPHRLGGSNRPDPAEPAPFAQRQFAKPNMSIASQSPRRSRRRAACSPNGAGPRST